MAEYISVPAENLVKIPDELSYHDAAAIPIAGLTAYHGLYSVGNLNEGDIFFIWGGSGGLGTYTIQLAKLAGATVVATVGKDEKSNGL